LKQVCFISFISVGHLLEVMRSFVFLIAILFVFSSPVLAQKTIEAPDENASVEEVQKWLVGSLEKYGSYKTRGSSVDVSNVRFESCTLKYVVTRKSGSTSTAVMGATRTVNTAKEEVAIDAALMSNDRVKLTDNVFPELQTIEIALKTGQVSGLGDDRVIELVVKSEAAKAIRTALVRLAGGCAKN